jgi:curved DNA-binding protein CbpA
MALTDPYKVLGIPHSASDAEIRAAYRRQVQLHHPDHNNGSAESARRFEEVQQAYALIRRLDRSPNGGARRTPPPPPPPRRESSDPGLDARLAEMERELAAQRAAKEEAARRAEQIRSDALRQAREATRADADRSADEDLGYVSTDDSFSAIFDDAVDAWTKRHARSPGDAPRDGESAADRPHEAVNERLADLFDDLGSRLRGDKRRDSD